MIFFLKSRIQMFGYKHKVVVEEERSKGMG